MWHHQPRILTDDVLADARWRGFLQKARNIIMRVVPQQNFLALFPSCLGLWLSQEGGKQDQKKRDTTGSWGGGGGGIRGKGVERVGCSPAA